MDPTTQALLFALLGAVLGGGVVFAWRFSEEQQARVAAHEEPAVPAGVATVLSVLRSSALVVDENDQVVISYMQATAVDIRPGNTRPTGPMPGQAGSGTSGAS